MGRKRKPIPHFYGKVIVALCVANMIAMGWKALDILETTEKDPSVTLGVALGAIGIELLGSFVRTITNDKYVSESDTERSAGNERTVEQETGGPVECEEPGYLDDDGDFLLLDTDGDA